MSEGSVLDRMFRARNQIVHELDLKGSGVRRRKIVEVQEWVTEALVVGQEVINAVAIELNPP